jgi:uncharacterized protein
MVLTSRRPRLALGAVLLSVWAAGCSLVRPEETPLDRQGEAAQAAREGKHADAAQDYAQLAGLAPADRDNYLLLAAEQWLAAGNIANAKQSFEQVSAEARTKLPTSRALVAAEIAYADADPARAIRELDQLQQPPSTPDQAQNYWWIRGRSAFLTNHPLEGVKALVERERYLSDAAALRANRDELYARVRSAAEHGTATKAPPKTDPVVAGWLDLGPVAVELARDPLRAAAALASWRRQYPSHPANDSVLTGAQTELAAATSFPDQIALLLPLSGRAEAAGVAVRDGFLAAYLEQDAATRPRLKIYDVAAESVSTAYEHAISEGAGFVVGPLNKEDVAALAPLSAQTPVLALNFLADSAPSGKAFYQFALLPEDEARSVARRAIADGKTAGVAIVPIGELGNRVAAAFAEEFKSLGGRLLDVGRYEGAQADFGEVIKTTLQVRNIKGEPGSHRADAQFVFMVASPNAARLIMPQLKFHFSGDLPVYSTSDAFEPDAAANGDVDGMLFPDMPWMVSNDTVTAQIRDSVRAAWPARAARRDRLYAFGFDAYRLLPSLRGKSPGETNGLAGVSGKLRVDEHNRVRRELDWAQIRGGQPNAL